MNACHLVALFITFQRLHYFETCPLVSDFFILIINRESQLYLYQQMRRDYLINFTNELKANLWIHLDLAKVDRSYILISIYHFLSSFSKSKEYYDSPQTFVVSGAGFDLMRHLPCFLPARFRRMRVSLGNQNKCKPCIVQ